MKKKIVLMLTVIMLIGLAGCGKNQINIKETGTSDNNEQMVQNIYENKRTEVKQKISEIKDDRRKPELCKNFSILFFCDVISWITLLR